MTDRLLTATEVADRLGVDESWVREHTRAGNIPFVPLGRWRRYDWNDVKAWLETCKRPGRPVTFRQAA